MLLQGFPEEFQCRLLVSTLRDEAFQHLAFVIDGAPEVVLHAIDLHEHFVEMPAPMPEGSPGMEMPDTKPDPFSVMAFSKDGQPTVFLDYPSGYRRPA